MNMNSEIENNHSKQHKTLISDTPDTKSEFSRQSSKGRKEDNIYISNNLLYGDDL